MSACLGQYGSCFTRFEVVLYGIMTWLCNKHMPHTFIEGQFMASCPIHKGM